MNNRRPLLTDVAIGNLNELNLNQPFYLGGIPPSADNYFNGAIQRIVINGIIQRNIIDKAINLVNVQPYHGPPCGGIENTCHNDGQCLPWCKSLHLVNVIIQFCFLFLVSKYIHMPLSIELSW